MKHIVLIIIVLIVSGVSGQKVTYTVSGIVLEDSTNTPIPYVKVYQENNKDHYAYSDKDGRYSLLLSIEKNDKIIFDHVGYEKDYYQVKNSVLKNENVKSSLSFIVNIELSSRVLGTVTIGIRKVDTVFGSDQFSVEDFMLLEDDNLLLLAYERKLDKDPKLLLVDNNKKLLAKYTIPAVPNYLFKDFAGKHYVVCHNKVYQIVIHYGNIDLMKIENEDFYGFYNRVIDTIGDNFYYSNYNELYPAVKFYVSARGDTTHKELYEVKDDFMMELYRAQFKYVSGRDKLWAYRQEQVTGIDKEVWIGASCFTQDILYKPVYAPLFVVNDTVLLFDQYKNIVLKYSEFHDKLNEIEVDYHIRKDKEKWEQPLLKDPKTNNIFGIYNSGGYTYIKQINYYTGTTGELIKLKYRFIEKIKIIDGMIYYIYRPFESLQKKFLYKEKLD